MPCGDELTFRGIVAEIKRQASNIDEQGNVEFLDQERLDSKVIINQESCVGCGICKSRCNLDAIQLKQTMPYLEKTMEGAKVPAWSQRVRPSGFSFWSTFLHRWPVRT